MASDSLSCRSEVSASALLTLLRDIQPRTGHVQGHNAPRSLPSYAVKPTRKPGRRPEPTPLED